MTRPAATLATPVSLWDSLTAPLRGLSKLVPAGAFDVSGLDALDRQNARIRLSGRHWLM